MPEELAIEISSQESERPKENPLVEEYEKLTTPEARQGFKDHLTLEELKRAIDKGVSLYLIVSDNVGEVKQALGKALDTKLADTVLKMAESPQYYKGVQMSTKHLFGREAISDEALRDTQAQINQAKSSEESKEII